MIVVGVDDFKIRFFDPYSLRHELTFDCEGQWPFSMVSFLFPDDIDPNSQNIIDDSQNTLMFDDPIFATDKKGFSGWFCWGDGEGEIHFMPEKQLLSFRTQHEVVPFFRSGVKGLWNLKIFRGQEHATGIWVTTLIFLPDVGLAGIIIAAASNGHVCVVNFEGRRVFHYYIQHRLSVKSLAWCGRQNNMLASAGLDRDIHLWRPVAIRNGKPILAGTLVGHNAGVTALIFHEKRDVLFSLDSHSATLVWDLSSKTLMTKINPPTQNPFDISSRVKLIMVNQRTRHLITATNHLMFWGVRALDLRDGSDKLVQHVSEILITLYNSTFDLMLTGDKNALISLWNVKTGAQQFKFYCEPVQETFGPPLLAAASFDISHRRLMIGWNQGSVQIYNFSNGTILRNLATDSTTKVTAVGQYSFQRSREMHHYFTASFEDGLLLQWADDKNPSDIPVRKIEVPVWMGRDFSEIAINDMARGSIGSGQELQSVLATVREDGIGLFWDITTGFPVRPHDASQTSGKKSRPHKKGTMQDERAPSTAASVASNDDFGRVITPPMHASSSSPTRVPSFASHIGSSSPMLAPISLSGDGSPVAKESLCLQITESTKVATTCVRVLNHGPHIALVADVKGIVHIVNMATIKTLGRVAASSRAGRFMDDGDYEPRINVMEIDFTDSFLIVGDEMGEVQVWDISQVFDKKHK